MRQPQIDPKNWLQDHVRTSDGEDHVVDGVVKAEIYSAMNVAASVFD